MLIVLGRVFAFIILSASAFGEPIQIVTEDYPPYNYEVNGELTGFSTEVVKLIVQKLGMQAQPKLLPWARAYLIALKNKNTLLYTTTRNQERENLFKWVGPLAPRTLFLFKLKTRDDIKINSLEDAKKHRIGVVIKGAFSQNLISKGFVVGKNINQVSNEEQNIKMLFLGRIDLIGNVELYMAYELKSLGLDFTQLEKVYEFPDNSSYYMAFNKKTPDTIVNSFQKALDELKQDGTYQKIAEKYLK